jgi:hypothetical protein
MSTLQVDRIIPYQSSSVTVEGLSAPNLATTGSNTFVGDQDIQGTITASIQEGFALVGGVGDVSTLVATSSLTGDSFPYTGDAVITGSLTISGSSTNDLTVVGNIKSSGSSTSNTITPNSFTATNNSGGGVGGALDFGGYLAVSTADASELSLAADANTYSGNWANGPAIVSNSPSNTYPAIIGFQNKTNWTDGRPTFLTPVDFTNNVIITGSVTISGSATNDLTIQGRQLITGPTTGQTPQLVISSSDATNTIGSRIYQVGKPGFDYPVFTYQYTAESSSILINYTENLSATASYNVGVFDNGFTQDVELWIVTTIGNGIQFKDIRSDTGVYVDFLKIAPNGGSNPPLEFKRSAEVTGSVSISDVLQLAGQDPLPAGAVGQLAVSGSNLYYNNGATWTQIN